jgi:hypothetical protein
MNPEDGPPPDTQTEGEDETLDLPEGMQAGRFSGSAIK